MFGNLLIFDELPSDSERSSLFLKTATGTFASLFSGIDINVSNWLTSLNRFDNYDLNDEAFSWKFNIELP